MRRLHIYPLRTASLKANKMNFMEQANRMWLRLTLNPILPKLVLDNRQLPYIFVFCSHIPPFAAAVPPTGSPHILISAEPSDITNSAVNTFRWNQQTSETSVIERVGEIPIKINPIDEQDAKRQYC